MRVGVRRRNKVNLPAHLFHKMKASKLIKHLQDIIDSHGDDYVCIHVSEPSSEPDGDDYTDAHPLKTVEVSKTYNAIVLYR